jgi:membrane-associated two-gene conflict system component 1 (EACC1)
VRLALLALAAAVALVLWRRGRTPEPRVVVAWPDGTEIRLREGRTEHERIVAAAGRALG